MTVTSRSAWSATEKNKGKEEEGNNKERKNGVEIARALAHETQDRGRAENHVRREIRLLALLAVDLERHARRGQGERVAAYERRPDGREMIECLGVEELPAAVLGHLE